MELSNPRVPLSARAPKGRGADVVPVNGPVTGIMDWGIGGLSVYNVLRVRGGSYLYVSDSGFTPYGRTQRDDLRDRLKQIASFFRQEGLSRVYVACNAASCALNSDIENFDGVEMISIIPAGVKAATSLPAARVGVIGGELTISSRIYQKRLSGHPGTFSFAAAQPLSAFVEAGELGGVRVEAAIRDVLDRLGAIDALVLACTHYPALRASFQNVAPQLQLLDPAQFLEVPNAVTTGGDFRLLTSGSREGTQKAAKLAFGVSVESIGELPLAYIG